MRVGALVIGQTPRPDLESVLGIPGLDVRGALDFPGALPIATTRQSVFPLRTRLNDGSTVVVDEPWLAPLLQRHIQDLERDEADAIVLACAGPFSGLTSNIPLIHPFRLAVRTLRAMGIGDIVALVPIAEQRIPAEKKWRKAGFQVSTAVFAEADPAAFEVRTEKAVVFDYVGLPEDTLARARRRVTIPVLDLGHLAAGVLQSMIS